MGCALQAGMALSGLKFGSYVWYVYGVTSITYMHLCYIDPEPEARPAQHITTLLWRDSR